VHAGREKWYSVIVIKEAPLLFLEVIMRQAVIRSVATTGILAGLLVTGAGVAAAQEPDGGTGGSGGGAQGGVGVNLLSGIGVLGTGSASSGDAAGGAGGSADAS
jgi:hypothetical protein